MIGQQQSQQNQMRIIEEEQLQRNSKEEELRNTLKKCPPKVNGAKLPDAFSNINLMKKNKNQLGQLNGKIAQLGKQIDPIKNLENMVEQQEYKVVQNLLQPINVNEERAEKDIYTQEQNTRRKDIIHLQSQQQQQALPFKALSSNHNAGSLKNPLAPLKSYMMNIQYLQENLKEQLSDLSSQKYQLLDANKQQQQLQLQQQQYIQAQPSKIKLEEMITLGIMKGSSCAVKKMLHAPTLKLYAVKEEPVPSKEIRIVLRDWAVFWQNKLHQTGRHIKLYGTFWNTPEGCVSILTEFMSANSLQNLLDNFGTLPEGVIKKIIPTIITGLQEIHNLSPQCFGSLTPSQILFKSDGSLKLSLGISYRTSPQQAGAFFSCINQPSKNLVDRIGIQDPIASPSIMKANSNSNINGQNNTTNQTEQISKSDDIFRLGLLMITCSAGSFNILQHQALLMECIQVLLDQANKQDTNNKNTEQLCCLLHSEQLITQLITQKINQQQQSPSLNQMQQQNNNNSSKYQQQTKSFLSLNDLLSPSRFSEQFLSFLCNALQFNWQKRATLEQLKQHPFIQQQQKYQQQQKGVNVSLTELLKISQEWNRDESLPVEHQGLSEQQLDRLCDAMLLVLPNCQKWFTASNYMEYTKHIKHLSKDSTYLRALAKDLGINTQLVYDKISQVYKNIPFIQQYNKLNNNNNSNQDVSPQQFFQNSNNNNQFQNKDQNQQ